MGNSVQADGIGACNLLRWAALWTEDGGPVRSGPVRSGKGVAEARRELPNVGCQFAFVARPRFVARSSVLSATLLARPGPARSGNGGTGRQILAGQASRRADKTLGLAGVRRCRRSCRRSRSRAPGRRRDREVTLAPAALPERLGFIFLGFGTFFSFSYSVGDSAQVASIGTLEIRSRSDTWNSPFERRLEF